MADCVIEDILVDRRLKAPDPERQRVENVLKQGARCTEMFEEKREELLATLDADERRAAADLCSPLSHLWMTAIPTNQYQELSDHQVAVGLHFRTLCPGIDNLCPHCAKANDVGHDDVCQARPNLYTYRHEGVKGTLARHLETEPTTTVRVEPHHPEGPRRTDLLVRGPAASRGIASEYDLKITSPQTQIARKMPVVAPVDGQSQAQADRDQLLAYLVVVEQEKRKLHDGKTTHPFEPVIISLGGTLSPSTNTLFSHWKDKLTDYNFKSMMNSISIQLLSARARYFEHGGLWEYYDEQEEEEEP